MAIASAFASGTWCAGGGAWAATLAGAFLLLFGISLLYPIAGCIPRAAIRRGAHAERHRLHGAAAARRYKAIQWLNQKRAGGGPVILEAPEARTRVRAGSRLRRVGSVLGWDLTSSSGAAPTTSQASASDIERLQEPRSAGGAGPAGQVRFEYVYVGDLEAIEVRPPVADDRQVWSIHDVIYVRTAWTISRRGVALAGFWSRPRWMEDEGSP